MSEVSELGSSQFTCLYVLRLDSLTVWKPLMFQCVVRDTVFGISLASERILA